MSIRSDLYRFVKAAVMTGTFTDCLDNVYTFTTDLGVKHFGFWNSQIANPSQHSNFPAPAVFFELSGNDLMQQHLKVSITEDRATVKDDITFKLHFIGGKQRSEDATEDDYLDLIDLADSVFAILNGRSFSGCKDIFRTDEVQDIESRVLMDYQATYKCQLINFGTSDRVDANDTDVNENAPVIVQLQNISLYQPSQEGIGNMFIDDDFVVN